MEGAHSTTYKRTGKAFLACRKNPGFWRHASTGTCTAGNCTHACKHSPLHYTATVARSLVIEDDPDGFSPLQSLHANAGHTVVSARTGAIGLAVAQYHARPALIVCALLLPDMDGRDVIRHLKADPELHAIPVVALTSLSEPAMRRSIAEAGAESCCVKPLDPDQFVRQVEALLPLANRPAE